MLVDDDGDENVEVVAVAPVASPLDSWWPLLLRMVAVVNATVDDVAELLLTGLFGGGNICCLLLEFVGFGLFVLLLLLGMLLLCCLLLL